MYIIQFINLPEQGVSRLFPDLESPTRYFKASFEIIRFAITTNRRPETDTGGPLLMHLATSFRTEVQVLTGQCAVDDANEVIPLGRRAQRAAIPRRN